MSSVPECDIPLEACMSALSGVLVSRAGFDFAGAIRSSFDVTVAMRNIGSMP